MSDFKPQPIVFLAWLAEYVVIFEAIYLDEGRPLPEGLANTEKLKYVKLSDKDQSSFNVMIALGSALYRVAKVEILDSEGRWTDKSAKTIEEMQHLLEQA